MENTLSLRSSGETLHNFRTRGQSSRLAARAFMSTRLVMRETCDVPLSHLQWMVRLICGGNAHAEILDGSGTLASVQLADSSSCIRTCRSFVFRSLRVFD
jgi:hypothetical protein